MARSVLVVVANCPSSMAMTWNGCTPAGLPKLRSDIPCSRRNLRIKDFLIAERLSPGVVLALQHAWGLHAAARTDTRNPINQWLRDVAADFASAYLDDPALYGSIADFLQAGMLHIRAPASAEGKDGLDVYQRNEYQMKAALLYEWQDGQETRQGLSWQLGPCNAIVEVSDSVAVPREGIVELPIEFNGP